MIKKLPQKVLATAVTATLIGGSSIGFASAASAAEPDPSVLRGLVTADVDVNLLNKDSLANVDANANLNLGGKNTPVKLPPLLSDVTAKADVNVAQQSTVSPQQPLTSGYVDVNLGNPSYVAPAPAPVPLPAPAPIPAPAPVPEPAPAQVDPAAQVSVAVNAATNAADGVLGKFTPDNQGGLTSSLVDGTADIRIGNLEPNKNYDFILLTDNDAKTEPTILGTATANLDGVALIALPSGLVNSGDGSKPGLLNLDGNAVSEATGSTATDSIVRLAVLPGGSVDSLNPVGNLGLPQLVEGAISPEVSLDAVTPVLDNMVGWVDPVTGLPADNGNTDGNSGNDGSGAGLPGSNGSGANGGTGGNEAVLPGNNVAAISHLSSSATEVSSANNASDNTGDKGLFGNLASTGMNNMGLLALGGLMITAGAGAFFLRKKLGLTN